MKSTLWSVLLLTLAAAAPASAAAADELFGYDASRPVKVVEKSSEKQGAVVVHDISFSDASGGTMTAYLVTPERKGKRPFAAVLFVHWFGDPKTSNRTQFLGEAKELAEQGVVSLLVDMPWSVPGWFRNRQLDDDYDFSIRQVKNLRRALDVLLSREGVDSSRVAYVGHDFGACYGAMMLGVETRVRAAVLMAATPVLTDWYLLGAKLEGEKRGNFIKRIAPLDPTNYIGKAKSVSVLFQFAKTDEYVTIERAQMFADAAPPSRQLDWYDAGHELNAAAAADRMRWLKAQLKLPAE